MATIPEDWLPASYSEAVLSQSPSQPVSMFWRYYWLMTGGAGLLGIGLLIGQANPHVTGLTLLGAIGLFVVGLIPCLIGTAENRIACMLSERIPGYQHHWSTAAQRFWATHWVMLLVIVGLFITASQVQARGARDVIIVAVVLLSFFYIGICCFVLVWRWRRMRLAQIAALEELQSFELLLENNEVLTDLGTVLPIFSGKLKDRCPFMLRRHLGDWSVLVFDWLDMNKEPPRREWITVALIGLHQPLPTHSLQPIERVVTTHLHWWHIFLEFPFGLIIFLVSAATHFANKLKSKPPLAIVHTPALTRGYQLDTDQIAELHKYLSPSICQDILKYVHKKKRFVMVNQGWLLLASHNKALAPKCLGELVADALQLTDVLERAKDKVAGSLPSLGERS